MFKKLKSIVERFQSRPNTQLEINNENNTVNSVKNEETIATDNDEVMEYFSEQMGIPIFKGEVEHAYESDFLGYTNECPRCKSPTQNKISNFSYATQSAPIIMTGAAGHFCINCPTVIINDDIVRTDLQEEEEYYGVFTIETDYYDTTLMFTTFNGEKIIYILNEDGEMGGIAQSVHLTKESKHFDFLSDDPIKRPTTPTQQRKKSTNKRKNKAARKARRRNRKR